MFTSGFAEIGAAGEAAQRRIAALAARTGMRVLGPNCLGAMNLPHRLFATFAPPVGMGAFATGPIGLVSQSGAFGGFSFALARERGIGLSAWATTGNEADVEFSDCLAWLARDDNTRAILGYMEGCRNGAKLVAALEAVRAAGKPLVIVKVGRSAAGAAAAASHTASLTGEDAVYDAVFRQHGVWRARSIEEFFDLGYAAAVGHLPRGRSVAMVTVSGGVGALMADDAAEHGLEAPALPEAAQAAIRAIVPFAGTRNPIDVTGQVANDSTILGRIFEIIVSGGQYDSLVSFVSARGLAKAGAPELVEIARRLRAERPELLVAFCSLFRAELRQALEFQGCLTFDDPSRAMRALGALGFFATSLRRRPAAPIAAPQVTVPPGAASEVEALGVLGAAGIPVVPHVLARTAEEAAAAAEHFVGPVAVKIVSRDIMHKSDIGGVRLGVAGAAAAREAFAAVSAAARRAMPGAPIDGALVAPMVGGGVECILGVQRDPVFGAVVLFGLGGIHVEALKDASFRLAPFDEAEALRMIREIRAFPILAGMRGREPCDLGALARALASLSRFAAGAGESLATLDINPFLVLPEGQGAVALDAVLVGAVLVGVEGGAE
jgi:acyl-CoA synthetase (NDP forming)